MDMNFQVSRDAMELNENAIAFLQAGDHQKTIDALVDAVSRLEALTLQDVYQQSQSDQTNSSSKKQIRDLSRIESIAIPEDRTGESSESNNNVFPYYSRALFVHANFEDKDQFGTARVHMRISSILLYNIALLRHHEALRHNSALELINALNLYELSYFTIKRAQKQLSMEDVFVLLLGLFFNMSDIHQRLYNTVECQHCVDWLQKAMASREIITLSEDDYLFFSTNISLLSFQIPYLAPAA